MRGLLFFQGAKPFVLWRQHMSFNLVLNAVACVKFNSCLLTFDCVYLCQMTPGTKDICPSLTTNRVKQKEKSMNNPNQNDQNQQQQGGQQDQVGQQGGQKPGQGGQQQGGQNKPGQQGGQQR